MNQRILVRGFLEPFDSDLQFKHQPRFKLYILTVKYYCTKTNIRLFNGENIENPY